VAADGGRQARLAAERRASASRLRGAIQKPEIEETWA